MYAGLSRLYGAELRTIIETLGEADKCILSGSTSDLLVVTVDGNAGNMLPSNVALVSEDKVRKWSFCVDYQVSSEFGVIHFKTPVDFAEKNRQAVAQAKFWDFNTLVGGFSLSEHNLVLGWEFLTQHHIKGITRIDYLNHGLSIDIMSMISWQTKHLSSNKGNIIY